VRLHKRRRPRLACKPPPTGGSQSVSVRRGGGGGRADARRSCAGAGWPRQVCGAAGQLGGRCMDRWTGSWQAAGSRGVPVDCSPITGQFPSSSACLHRSTTLSTCARRAPGMQAAGMSHCRQHRSGGWCRLEGVGGGGSRHAAGADMLPAAHIDER
jgi:hypothetical protein